jgi:hypothetical protein
MKVLICGIISSKTSAYGYYDRLQELPSAGSEARLWKQSIEPTPLAALSIAY